MACLGVLAGLAFWRSDLVVEVWTRPGTRRSVDDRLAEFGAAAEARLRRACAAAGVAWPPQRAVLVACKDARLVHWYATDDRDGMQGWRLVRTDGIRAASGHSGPKLQAGDQQVPEGRYRITGLNPNSSYHVSLRLDYPNAEDRAQAVRDGRSRLGGDIMIHGSAVSVGCLAMGDEVAEDYFTLAARIGVDRMSVLIVPTDFRSGGVPDDVKPDWVKERYRMLAAELARLPVPAPASPR